MTDKDPEGKIKHKVTKNYEKDHLSYEMEEDSSTGKKSTKSYNEDGKILRREEIEDAENRTYTNKSYDHQGKLEEETVIKKDEKGKEVYYCRKTSDGVKYETGIRKASVDEFEKEHGQKQAFKDFKNTLGEEGIKDIDVNFNYRDFSTEVNLKDDSKARFEYKDRTLTWSNSGRKGEKEWFRESKDLRNGESIISYRVREGDKEEIDEAKTLTDGNRIEKQIHKDKNILNETTEFYNKNNDLTKKESIYNDKKRGINEKITQELNEQGRCIKKEISTDNTKEKKKETLTSEYDENGKETSYTKDVESYRVPAFRKKEIYEKDDKGSRVIKSEVYEDRDKDGKLDYKTATDNKTGWTTISADKGKGFEEIDSFKPSLTSTHERKDLNNWTVLQKDKYYDNLMDYLGKPDDKIKQKITERKDEDGTRIYSSIFTSDKNPNVEIILHHRDANYDINKQEDVEKLNSEKPACVTFKFKKKDGTEFTKTTFPGAPKDTVASITKKEGLWRINQVETKLISDRFRDKTHETIRTATADKVSLAEVKDKLENEFGYKDKNIPESVKKFIEVSGEGDIKAAYTSSEDHLKKTCSQSIILVNKKGAKLIVNGEGQDKAEYYSSVDDKEQIVNIDKNLYHFKDDKLKFMDKKDNTSFYLNVASKIGKIFRALPNIPYYLSKSADFISKHPKVFTQKLSEADFALKGSEKLVKKQAEYLKNRKMGAILGTIGLANDIIDITTQGPNTQNIKNLSSTTIGLGYDIAVIAGKGKVGALGKTLGIVGVGLQIGSVGMNLYEGEYTRAALDTAGAIGSGLSIAPVFGAGAWAGPVGVGIAVAALSGAIAYEKYVREDEIATFDSTNLEKYYNVGFMIDPENYKPAPLDEGYSGHPH
ncbi:MAG TPA: hypothetical protein PL110_00790 [Candidatus Eremiobacteraeota bacterium]|nr:hypothetical protein [Candidatus Eremiobacteraeota bacterium]